MHYRLAFALVASVLLGACATLPEVTDRPHSEALAPSAQSPLAAIALRSTPGPSQTGFRLLPEGFNSLDARVELVRRSTASLDLQYYLIQNDRTGRLLMRNLRDAALRGVRVRLLVDDLNTAGADDMFRGLAAFPNVEVRLFNPFCCARGSLATRFAASLMDFTRLNHRMHNKLFIADGAMAVMGGRNIADEYFARSAMSNFLDMDVLVVGDVVSRLAGIFDGYWNSAQAYPIESVLREPADPEALRRAFDRLVDVGPQMMTVPAAPMDMLGHRRLGVELDSGRLELAWGTARVFADLPAKVMATSREMASAMSVQMNVMDRVSESNREVLISSPYFVPGDAGVEAFAALRKRGVDVVILTNSLATNDVPVVHIGYARYRVRLLRSGVQLYELSPNGDHQSEVSTFTAMSQGRLHAKAAVIDQSMVYIGSSNLDPRSDSTNTELGMVARCPELAMQVRRVIDASVAHNSYRLQFGPDGEHLEWIVMGKEPEVVLTSEPDVTGLTQLRNMLLAPFVPDQLL
ncbi:MAG TPA: phospholipase D family protein [Casimicrobiaceae bacterium]|nr:phospholipase D family protein [Casimicrobiaceae bacterium]